jgi:predicted nucleic acid-binding protein
MILDANALSALVTAALYALVRFELKSRGHPIPYHDIWIAALARQHGLAVVSQDTHSIRFAELGAYRGNWVPLRNS